MTIGSDNWRRQKLMDEVKMVYGGYVSYPLAPKDVKNVQKMVDQYTTSDDLQSLLTWFSANNLGIKLENKPGTAEWKCVAYNLLAVRDGDNHTYYISGESDTLMKCLIVARYKFEQMISSGIETWVKEQKKSEFR
jgi:hypothetical protein